MDTYCVGSMPSICRGADPEGELQGTTCWAPTTVSRRRRNGPRLSAVYLRPLRAVSPRRLAKTEKVDFFAGQSTTKIPAGEMFGQAFYTLAFMHGVGTPGNYVGWLGMHEHGYSTTPYCFAGDASNGAGKNPVNPLAPPVIVLVPNWLKLPTRLLGKGGLHRVLAVHSRRGLRTRHLARRQEAP